MVTGKLVALSCSLVLCMSAAPLSVAQSHGDELRVTMRELGCRKATVSDHTAVTAVTREGKDLVASVLAVSSCGLHAQSPEALASGNSVALSWAWVYPTSGMLPECECAYDLVFRVSGAPEGNVSVTVATH